MMKTSQVSIYILALEPSGDVLGARLIQALQDITSGEAVISGVGGEEMKAVGLQSLFDPSDLAILGIFEVLPKAGLVLRRVGDVLADIERVKPDILVTIDSWGFTGRIHKALSKKKSSVKRLRYVAPQVWAWRPGRAKQLAGWIDHLLTLFPFEPPLFQRYGLDATWVGHPVTEGKFSGDGERFRAHNNIGFDVPVLTVLPGSRMSEVRSLMPVFAETIQSLKHDISDLVVVVPTVSNVAADVREWAETLPMPVIVVIGENARDDAFDASLAALSASGTVTLEMARAELPHVIAYKVNPLSAFVFKRLAKTQYVNLINVLMQRECVPECLQEKCTPVVLAEALSRLIKDESERVRQISAFRSAMALLQPSDARPSQLAARAILGLAHT